MAQSTNQVRPSTPRQAASRKGAIDEELDPGLLKALSDPTRLSLVACIAKCGRGCSVGEVAECCSVDLSVVSRHLALLAQTGVLEATKEGRTVRYRVRYSELAGQLRSLASAIQECAPEPETTAASDACCDDGCCATDTVATTTDEVRDQVRAGYATIARGAHGAGGGCCGPSGTLTAATLAQSVGYGEAELALSPDGANLGLSCGNPTALASLRPGEVVLDLGSGGGFDCFIAGPKVGASGRVIGVDMTPEMITRARKNLASYRERSGLDNVEFRLGEIEALPVADASVDVVISNCVLNLSPDKPRVWKEIARVLKPGGRVAVSDLALQRPLPPDVKADVEALVGCVAGAVLIDETRAMAEAAQLTDIVLTPKPEYVDAMTSWEDPLYRRIVEQLPAGARTSDYVTSLDVSARKESLSMRWRAPAPRAR